MYKCRRDVAGVIDVTSMPAVREEALRLLSARFGSADWTLLETAFQDLENLYGGAYPGYHACDLGYHDLAHVLQVSLTAARLIDGFQLANDPCDRLLPEDALVAMLVALFHDSGYIRRIADRKRREGAEYTSIHVTRSGQFLRRWFIEHGLRHRAAEAAKLVHFTGYERDVSKLKFADSRLQQMGYLIGTADLIGQMADCCYLDKCRDGLFPEFVAGGVASFIDDSGREVVRYRNAIDLLRQTPGFIDDALKNRLGDVFDHCYRYAEIHFGGRNLYLEAILHNRDVLLDSLVSATETQLLQPFCSGCAQSRDERQ